MMTTSTNMVQEKKKIGCCYKELLPAKLYYLAHHYSAGNFIPFVNLYLVSIGLSVSQAGIVSGVRALFASVIVLAIGALTDYTQKPKVVVAITSMLCVIFTTPTPYIMHEFIKDVDRNMTCTALPAHNNETKQACSMDGKLHHPPLPFLIFWLGLVGGTGAAIMAIAERAIIGLLEDFNGKASYGMQRVFAPIGYSLGSFLTGLLIDGYVPKSGMSKYTVLFFTLAGSNSTVLFSLLMLNMNSQVVKRNSKEKRHKHMWKTFRQTLKKVHIIILISTVFIVGVCFALMNSYLLLLLIEIESSKTILGLTISVATISEIFIFPVSAKLLKLFGGAYPCFCMAVFSYFLRFLVYYASNNIWLVMVSQLLHSISNSMFWVGVNDYTYSVAPENISQSIFSLINVTFYMVSSTFANVIGGWLFQWIGGRYLFLLSAGLCLIWSVFLGFYIFCSRNKTLSKKKPETLLLDEVKATESKQ